MLQAIFGLPRSFAALKGMFAFHGFVLDTGIIGILPLVNEAASDAQRVEKFPWALGGYEGFEKVPNLGPTHRRFMTENAAYAILRGAPVFFLGNVPILTCAVASHLLEALSIAWEVISYKCPDSAMVPLTLMGIFSTQTFLTVKFNAGGYIKSSEPKLVAAMAAMVAATWLTWSAAAMSVASRKKKA